MASQPPSPSSPVPRSSGSAEDLSPPLSGSGGGLRARLLAYQTAAQQSRRTVAKQRSNENLADLLNASTGEIVRSLEAAARSPRGRTPKRPSVVGRLDARTIAPFHDSSTDLSPAAPSPGGSRAAVPRSDSGAVKARARAAEDRLRRILAAVEAVNGGSAGGGGGGGGGSGGRDTPGASLRPGEPPLPHFAELRARYLEALRRLAPGPLPAEGSGAEDRRRRLQHRRAAVARELARNHTYGSLKAAWDELEAAARDCSWPRAAAATEAELCAAAELAELEDAIDGEWVGFVQQVVDRAVAEGDTDPAEIAQWRDEALLMHQEMENRRKQKKKQRKREEEQYWKAEAERLRAELGDESERGSDAELQSENDLASPQQQRRSSASAFEKASSSSLPRHSPSPAARRASIVSERTKMLLSPKPPLAKKTTEHAPRTLASIPILTEKEPSPQQRYQMLVQNSMSFENSPSASETDIKLDKLIKIMTDVDHAKTTPANDAEVRKRYMCCIYKLVPSEIPSNLTGVAKSDRLIAEYKKKSLYKRLQIAWDFYDASTRKKGTGDHENDAKIQRIEDMCDSAWLGFARLAVAQAATENITDPEHRDIVDQWRNEALRLKTLSIKRKRRKGRRVTKKEADAAAAAEQGIYAETIEERIYQKVSVIRLVEKSLTEDELNDHEKQIFQALDSVASQEVREWNDHLNWEEDPKSKTLADIKKRENTKAAARLSAALSGIDGKKSTKAITFADAKNRYMQAIFKLAPSAIPSQLTAKAKSNKLLQEARKKKKYEQLKSNWDKYETSLGPFKMGPEDEKAIDGLESVIDSSWLGFARTIIKQAAAEGEGYEGEAEKWKAEALRLRSEVLARRRRKQRTVTKKEAALAAAAAAGISMPDDELDEEIYLQISELPLNETDFITIDEVVSSRQEMENRLCIRSGSEDELLVEEAVIRRPELLVGTAFENSIHIEEYFDEHKYHTVNGSRIEPINPWDELSGSDEEISLLTRQKNERKLKAKLCKMAAEVTKNEVSPASLAEVRSMYVDAVKRLVPAQIPGDCDGAEKRKALRNEARKKEMYNMLQNTFDAFECLVQDQPEQDEEGAEKVAKTEDLVNRCWAGFAKYVMREAEADGDANEYEDEVEKWKNEAMRMKAEALARKRRKKRKVTKKEVAVAAAAAAGLNDGEDELDDNVFLSFSTDRPGIGKPWDTSWDDEGAASEDLSREEETPPSGSISLHPIDDKEPDQSSTPAGLSRQKLATRLNEILKDESVAESYAAVQNRYIQALHKLAPSIIPQEVERDVKKNSLLTESRKLHQYQNLKRQWDVYEALAPDRPAKDSEEAKRVARSEGLIDKAYVGFATTVVAQAEKDEMDNDSDYEAEVSRWKMEAMRLKALAVKRKRHKGQKVRKIEVEEANEAKKGMFLDDYDEKVYREVATSFSSNGMITDESLDECEHRIFQALSKIRPGVSNFWEDAPDSEVDEQSKNFSAVQQKETEEAIDSLSNLLTDIHGVNISAKDYVAARSQYAQALLKLTPVELSSSLHNIPKTNVLLAETKKKNIFDSLLGAWDRYDAAVEHISVNSDVQDRIEKTEDLITRAWAGFAKTVVRQSLKEDCGDDEEYDDEIDHWKAEAESLKAKALARKRRKQRKVTKEEAAAAAAAAAGLFDREDVVDELIYSEVSKIHLPVKENDGTDEWETLKYIDKVYESVSRSRPGMTNPWDDLSDASVEERLFAEDKPKRQEFITGTVFDDSDSTDSLYEEYKYATIISGMRPGQGNPWDALSDSEEEMEGSKIENKEQAAKKKFDAVVFEVVGGDKSSTGFRHARQRYMQAIQTLAPSEIPRDLKGKPKVDMLREEAEKRTKFVAVRSFWDKYEAIATDKSKDDKNNEVEVLKIEETLEKGWCGFAKAVVHDADAHVEDTDEEYEDEVEYWRDEAMRMKAQALARKRRKKRKVTKMEHAIATAAAAGYDDGENEEDERIYRAIASCRPGMPNPWDKLSKKDNDEEYSEAEEEPVYATINMRSSGDYPWYSLKSDDVIEPPSGPQGRGYNEISPDEKERQLRETLGSFLSDADPAVGGFANFSEGRMLYSEALKKLFPVALPKGLKRSEKTGFLRAAAATKAKYENVRSAYNNYNEICGGHFDTSPVNESIRDCEDMLDRAWSAFGAAVVADADHDSDNDSDYEAEINRWRDEAQRLMAQVTRRKRKKGKRDSGSEAGAGHHSFSEEDHTATSASLGIVQSEMVSLKQRHQDSLSDETESGDESEDGSVAEESVSEADSSGGHKKKKAKRKAEKKKKKKKDEKKGEKKRKKKEEKRKKKTKEKFSKRPPDKHNLKEDALGQPRNMDGTIWRNPLRFWQNKATTVDIEGAAIIMKIPSKTDYLRQSDDGDIADSGPFYWHKITGNFELIVKISSDMRSDMDKAGLMIRLDESNWIMTGMESFGGRIYNSSLVTTAFTDWSGCLLPRGAEKQGIWFCFKRFHNSYECFYSYDALTWHQTRQGVFSDRPVLSVGIAGACPSSHSFHATYEYYRVKSV